MNDEIDIFEIEAKLQVLQTKAKLERFGQLCKEVEFLPYDEKVKLFQFLVEELSGS